MSNSIDNCVNVIRIRHYRKQGATVAPKRVSPFGFLNGADRLRIAENLALDSLQTQASDAQHMCIDCARYALSRVYEHGFSNAQLAEYLAADWSTDEQLKRNFDDTWSK